MFTNAEIMSGIYNSEFFIEYLPIVSLQNGKCIGGEALVRWRKNNTIIPPMEFIPFLEGSDLLGLLTSWIIDKVAEELGPWLRTTPKTYISLNVPPELFGRGGLLYVAYKTNCLDIANQFVIEITERGVPDKLGITAINNRHSGALFALDDVLAHEASLVVLGRLNIDIIKIDKSYTDKILLESWPTAHDKRFLRILHESNFFIIAEGIEQKHQAGVLKDAGIDAGQGWHFSRPLSAEKFKEYYHSHGFNG